jgi:hypothetical protein
MGFDVPAIQGIRELGYCIKLRAGLGTGAAHFTFPNVEYAAVCWTTPENRQGEVSCRKQSLPTSTGSSSFIFLTPCYSKSSPLFFATNNPGIRMFSSVMRSPFFLEKCL